MKPIEGKDPTILGEGKEDKIHDVINELDKDERYFIKNLPNTNTLTPIDVPFLIKKGLVAQIGKWVVLTPYGSTNKVMHNLPKEIQDWFQVLAKIPKRNVLTNLLKIGVIENRCGFPLLTTFGELVKEHLNVMEEYYIHNSWRFPTEFNDKDSP